MSNTELVPHREWLLRSHAQACQDFDKAIMALGGGALGVSIAFIRDIAPKPEKEALLATGWGLLALSLLVILSSFLASQWAIKRDVRLIDEGEEVKGGHWIVDVLNYGSALALVSGIACVVIFALYNLSL